MTSSLFRALQWATRIIQTVLVLLLCWCAPAAIAQDCKTELKQEKAWVGEPIQLIITLYSPGPFSGTASFDLPQLDATVILRKGSPVLGNETVDGESYLSQRHEFLVICQRAGQLRIPPIAIRYSGKPDFLSDPVELQTQSSPQDIRLIRPDAFQASQVIVSAREYQVEQTWSEPSDASYRPGDILIREVVQTIDGSTAMFLPEVSTTTPSGVRIYRAQPEVEDTVDRGVIRGQRKDVLKYQFESAGAPRLPDVQLQWWNLDQEQVETVRLDGRTIEIRSDQLEPASQESSDATGVGWTTAIAITACVCAALAVLFWLATRQSFGWFSPRQFSLATQVIKACEQQDAPSIYHSFLRWQRTQDIPLDLHSAELQKQWQRLSKNLFDTEVPAQDWDSAAFSQAFVAELARLEECVPHQENQLGPLNP